jgi:hypothetical protein
VFDDCIEGGGGAVAGLVEHWWACAGCGMERAFTCARREAFGEVE